MRTSADGCACTFSASAGHAGTRSTHRGGAARRGIRNSGRGFPAELVEGLPQPGDQLLAGREVPLLDIENAAEAAPLERQHVDPAGSGLDPSGVADDVDQPVEGMEAAQEIIVLAIGARE